METGQIVFAVHVLVAVALGTLGVLEVLGGAAISGGVRVGLAVVVVVVGYYVGIKNGGVLND